MSFIPRRSARLAALAAKDTKTPSESTAPRLVIEEIPVAPYMICDGRVLVVSMNDYKAVINAKNATEADAAHEHLTMLAATQTKQANQSKAKPTKEEMKAIFLATKGKGKSISDERKQECITIIKRYLDDCESTRGRTAKAVVATKLMRYLIAIPEFMTSFDRFHLTVLKKMNEFKQEGEIPDAVIDADFRQAVDDLLFVVA